LVSQRDDCNHFQKLGMSRP